MTGQVGRRGWLSATTASSRSTDPMPALQLLINGLALGAAYALVALGFVLVLNATGAVNFAQGDMVMAGGYAAAILASALPLPGLALLPMAVGAMALLG